MSRFDALSAELRREFPSFRVVVKEESPFMRALVRVAAMRLWNPRFLEDYTTVIGTRVFMPRDLIGTDAGYRTLRHERIHMRDARRTAYVGFFVTYLFALPAGLTMRAFWEARAYEESMRVELEDTGAISDESLARIEERFTGPDYLFMCPFPRFVRRRLEAMRTRLLRERER